MAQTPEGARKIAAARVGLTVREYERRSAAGLKWCTNCKEWHDRGAFKIDASRLDGLTAGCSESRNASKRARYEPVPLHARKRMGPPPNAPRDGDKAQARHRVNVEIRTGRRARANDRPCANCGHIWKPGEHRHEYHHHRGYGAAHHYDVIVVCVPCHRKLDAWRTHCLRGHEFTDVNTFWNKNGTRGCRACRRLREKDRPPRGSAYWKRVNAKRRKKS